MTASPAKITTASLFETKDCSRCGGSGHYSYCQMHGTRCFRCGGKGYEFTKAGAAALDAYKAAYTVTVQVKDLQPGDAVMVLDSMRGREIHHVVESSGPDDLNPGRWLVSFSKGTLGGHGFTSGEATLRRPATADDKRSAYESIAHMPGATGWPA